MKEQIQKLIEDIKADYASWHQRGRSANTEVSQKMVARFNEGIGYTVGKKYIKITKENNGCVWGFVVNTDDDKQFRKGDILKAAAWNAPARNAPRGNILDGNYQIQWTGPLYLRW